MNAKRVVKILCVIVVLLCSNTSKAKNMEKMVPMEYGSFNVDTTMTSIPSTENPLVTVSPQPTENPELTVSPLPTVSGVPTLAPSEIPTKTEIPEVVGIPDMKSVLVDNCFIIKAKKVGKDKLRLFWDSADDRIEYKVYVQEATALKRKYLKSVNKSYCNVNKIKSNKLYQFSVDAYFENKRLAKSFVLNIKTGEDDFMNVTDIKVKREKTVLYKKQYHSVKCRIVLADNELVLKTPKLQYFSSNKKVAKVDKKGKISALQKGKATIFVVAPNGVYDTVKVVVK